MKEFNYKIGKGKFEIFDHNGTCVANFKMLFGSELFRTDYGSKDFNPDSVGVGKVKIGKTTKFISN